MRNRIAGLFSRRQQDVDDELIRTDSHEIAVSDVTEPVHDESAESAESIAALDEPVHEESAESIAAPAVSDDVEVQWIDLGAQPTPMEPASADVLPLEPAASEEAAEPPISVTPPEDFRFPWTRPDLEQQATEYVPAEAPVTDAGDAFSSVEEALPMSGDAVDAGDAGTAGAVDLPGAAEEVEAELKRGFFARLFGRKPKQQGGGPERLSVEIYQDRIEAAANALDAAGEIAFTPGEDTLPAESDAFASVEDALPSDDDALSSRETLEPVEVVVPVAETFLPVDEELPSVEEATPPSEEPILSIGDLAPDEMLPAEDASRNTLEIEEPHVESSSRSTLEIEEPASETSSRGTLEIEERTDELEVLPALEELAPVAEKPDDATVSMEKKSIWSDSFVARLFRRGDTQVEKVGAAAQEEAEGSAVFLLAKFRAFYNEIIRFKHQKSEFTAGFATAIVADYTADESPDASAEGLSKRLSELLELQAAEAKWMGGEAADRYPDAQYAMAALADETFTHLEWEGQASWAKFSIEKRLYQTAGADVEVFRRIDRLLKEAPQTAVARDLARVYLLIIAAGFRGKYRPFGLTRALAEYRQRLYEYIHNDDPLMLYAPDRRIFPEAVSKTLEGHAVSRFTAAQRWAAILVFLILSYTLAAHVAWNSVAADLKDVTSRISAGTTMVGAR